MISLVRCYISKTFSKEFKLMFYKIFLTYFPKIITFHKSTFGNIQSLIKFIDATFSILHFVSYTVIKLLN